MKSLAIAVALLSTSQARSLVQLNHACDFVDAKGNEYSTSLMPEEDGFLQQGAHVHTGDDDDTPAKAREKFALM